MKQKGGSTLGGRQVWFDRDVLRLNYDNRGEHLGEFLSDDLILVVSGKGNFYTTSFDLNNHFDKDILVIEKFDPHKAWSVALWDAEQKFYYLKRFQLEPSAKPQNFLGDNPESRLMLMTDVDYPRFEVIMGGNDAYRETLVVDAEEFIGIKSFKAKGKRLTTFDVETINELEPVRFKEKTEEQAKETIEGTEEAEEIEDGYGEITDSNDEQSGSQESEVVEAKLELDPAKAPKVRKESEQTKEIEPVETPKPVSAISEIPKEKPAKEKKEKSAKTSKNDSTLPDDIVDGDGQLTLF